MFKYELHLHTSPVSSCASISVEENLKCYKEIGFDGVFITNHFLNGSINIDPSETYEKQIEYLFSDYYAALELSKKYDIKVFFGTEITYAGTDFLVYGLDKNWFLNNPLIMEMKISALLPFLAENGAFIVHAHPFREASYIDHIRLFPRFVEGVEVINACRTELENKMASIYAENYNLIRLAGTDNHRGPKIASFAGVLCETPITSDKDFIEKARNNELTPFEMPNPLL